MSNITDVASSYKKVIDGVIERVRPHFVNMGVDEQVLGRLQTVWEKKVMESGVFSQVPLDHSSIAHQIMAPISVPAVVAPGIAVNVPILAPVPVSAPITAILPPTPMQATPTVEKRRSQEALDDADSTDTGKRAKVDGNGMENVDKEEEDKEEHAKGVEPAEAKTTKEWRNMDDSEIGSDLDSDLDDDDIASAVGGSAMAAASGAGGSTKNQIVGLFDKVQRTRNRWRCNFNSCIARIDGRDYLFHKLNGEFEW